MLTPRRKRDFIDVTDERPSKRSALEKVRSAIMVEDDDDSEDTVGKKMKKGGRKQDVEVHIAARGGNTGRKKLIREVLGMSKAEAVTFAAQLSRLGAALLTEGD